jgi:hypothetical protein
MRLKFSAVCAALVFCCLLTACGHHRLTLTVTTPAGVTSTVPAPACGENGSPGSCAPKSYSLTQGGVSAAGVLLEDRSDNNPCDCGAQIRAAGFRGLIVKLNQGSEIDPTADAMAASARAAGLAVGGYDFDADYSVSEARTFIAAARAAGMKPGARNQLPLFFDVEWGNFSLSGLRAQIAYVRGRGWKVAEYTGDWYWGPHAGSVWTGVDAWLSGYPTASPVAGLATSLYRLHQFTDSPLDESVFLVDGQTGSLAQFKAYVNDAPRPKPVGCSPFKAQKTAKACAALRKNEGHFTREIHAQRVLLRAGHCYAHHTAGNCAAELQRGDVEHAALDRLLATSKVQP